MELENVEQCDAILQYSRSHLSHSSLLTFQKWKPGIK